MTAVRLLPQPTVEGKASGIIDTDPLTLQCGECGAIAVNDTGARVATFIILTRWLFCLVERERGGGPRRCLDCQAAHERVCERCRRS